jgi:hypothetical protein
MRHIDATLLLKAAGLLLAVILSAFASLTAEEQRQLDPAKPADAVQIVHLLTEKLTLPRDQAVALTRAIETLARLAEPAPAPAAPAAPTVDPKAKP